MLRTVSGACSTWTAPTVTAPERRCPSPVKLTLPPGGSEIRAANFWGGRLAARLVLHHTACRATGIVSHGLQHDWCCNTRLAARLVLQHTACSTTGAATHGLPHDWCCNTTACSTTGAATHVLPRDSCASRLVFRPEQSSNYGVADEGRNSLPRESPADRQLENRSRCGAPVGEPLPLSTASWKTGRAPTRPPQKFAARISDPPGGRVNYPSDGAVVSASSKPPPRAVSKPPLTQNRQSARGEGELPLGWCSCFSFIQAATTCSFKTALNTESSVLPGGG